MVHIPLLNSRVMSSTTGSLFSTLICLNISLSKAELLGEQIHDLVVGLGLEERPEHLLAPLQRAVGGRHRPDRLVLGCRRQQIDAVGAVVQHRR